MNLKSGIFEEDDEYMIIDLDVASYYPNLAIKNSLFPKQLSNLFCKVYEDIYFERKHYKSLMWEYRNTPKAEEADLIQQGLKLSLNGVFGKTNSEYSYLYSPSMTMSITLNGQLLLMMFVERLYEVIGETLTVIQANTDGVTIRVKRTDEKKVNEIVEWWQDLTSLELEAEYYEKMIIRDVNNYIAVYGGKKKGKVKYKGVFEYKKDLHKNHSALIIPKALEAYFVHGKSVRDFIRNHDDMYDFMCMSKGNSKWKPHIMNNSGEVVSVQKINRFYVSKSGHMLFRENLETGSRVSVLKDSYITIANDLRNTEFKDIKNKLNYNFYIKRAFDVINEIECAQTSLF